MTEEQAQTEVVKEEAKEWTEVEALKRTQFGALMQDYKEAITLLADQVARVKAIRELIVPLIQTLSFPVRSLDYQAKWHPETETYRLDKALLARAGVLPDQLKAGLKKGKKKAYMEIRPVKSQESPPESEDNS